MEQMPTIPLPPTTVQAASEVYAVLMKYMVMLVYVGVFI
jgi:hypothetical protein